MFVYTTKKFHMYSVHNKEILHSQCAQQKIFYMYSVHNKEILHVQCTQQRNFKCTVYATKKFHT